MFVATFMTSARKALSLGLVLLLATASFAQEAGQSTRSAQRAASDADAASASAAA